MTYHFFLASLITGVLYLACWVLFFISLPRDKIVILAEDITVGMSVGFIGQFVFKVSFFISVALMSASLIKDIFL
jgi:hypothetical protein